MRVLVTASSRHGFTTALTVELGARLRDSLPVRFARVDVRPIGDEADVTEYDAVVLGSAVYLGQWLAEARTFAAAHAGALAARPVWLFSGVSELAAEPDTHHTDARVVDLEPILEAISPVEHRVFVGHAVRPLLSPSRHGAVRPLPTPSSDFRDWAAVRQWAAHIATALTTTPAPAKSVRSRTPRLA